MGDEAGAGDLGADTDRHIEEGILGGIAGGGTGAGVAGRGAVVLARLGNAVTFLVLRILGFGSYRRTQADNSGHGRSDEGSVLHDWLP